MSALAKNRVELIHDSVHEFVDTHKAKSYGLYPLLNLLVLLIQKPIVLVIPQRPFSDVMASPAEGWVSSVPRSIGVRKRLEGQIAEKFSDVSSHAKWWVPQSEYLSAESKMYGLGVFYLRHEYELLEGKLESGERLKPESLQIDYLSAEDMDAVRELFASIESHHANFEIDNRPHLKHVARYWSQVCKEAWAEDSVESSVAPRLAPKAMARLLDPLLRELDSLYRDLRGGTPGDLSLNTREESGAPFLWSRHRRALEKGETGRPPTIAFYLRLRASDGAGYRIVPIFTESMAKDSAAVLIDHLESGGPCESIRTFLRQLGVPDTDSPFSLDVDELAGMLLRATCIENFLEGTVYNSVTYPAFSSGLSFFTAATGCVGSRCDRVMYGPDFLREPEGKDSAFVKPTLVSGFPFICFVTKTSAGIGLEAPHEFGCFEYNKSFQLGVIQSRASRRVRDAMRRIYLGEVERVVELSLLNNSRVINHHTSDHYSVEVSGAWLSKVNDMLLAAAQTSPYGLVKLANTSANANPEAEDVVSVFQNLNYELLIEQNPYYQKKLINEDRRYIKARTVKRHVLVALERVKRTWSLMHGDIDSGSDQQANANE